MIKKEQIKLYIIDSSLLIKLKHVSREKYEEAAVLA
jgi:hypothetical protein